MKTSKQILEQYGKCCVSEFRLSENEHYGEESNKKLEEFKYRDAMKLQSIRGQKISLEWLLE